MTSVKQMGYLGLGVSNLDAWEKFATEVLGLQSNGRSEDGALFLRMDEYHHRFIVSQDSKDDLNLIGWEVEDERALEGLTAQLLRHDWRVQEGTEDEAEARRVVKLIKFKDPSGIATEGYYGPLLTADLPFHSPRAIEGFVAARQGLGHITMTVDELDASVHFYRDLLGMRMSDWVQPQPGRGVESRFNIAFLHCNPRHHSIAFWASRAPKRMHHFMLQLKSVDDVGATYDLCHDRGVPIELTLGRHTNDQMLSFYLKTPSGFSVEYGWGAREVDDRDWQVQLHRTGSVWGHRRPTS